MRVFLLNKQKHRPWRCCEKANFLLVLAVMHPHLSQGSKCHISFSRSTATVFVSVWWDYSRKEKRKMFNSTALGVPVCPSFRNPSPRHSFQNQKALLQISLVISSSNTWVWDSHFCTTYWARGVWTTGQMLEALWLCVRSQKNVKQKSNHNHFLSERLHWNMQMILHVGKCIVTAQNTGRCIFFHPLLCISNIWS